ncbi:MAG: hypothetical protein AB7F35_20430 [Acetobacteraceae bacterium]
MRVRAARLAILFLLAAIPDAARGEPAESARQLAGLFMQSCFPYAGDPSGLRSWAARTGLPVLPEPARGMFLNRAPGVVWDASPAGLKLVLVSADDGLCSTITNRAPGRDVADALETDLRQIGARFRLVIERDDRQAEALHFREYLATWNGRTWRILAATVKGSQPGHAMLTAGPG